MPRWLTAATISLGIIFALWLCLTIPQNAPRQRVTINEAQPLPVKVTHYYYHYT